jgi:hypothetical protein
LGAASCFNITLTGTSGGNSLRIGFTQALDAGVTPFVLIPPVTGTTTNTVCFSDVACPDWAIDQGTCELTGQVYDLEIMVVGAERASTFELCLSSLIAA